MPARVESHKLAFNRGLVDPRGLARADIERLAMAAETQTNWIPRVLGSMTLRPGLGYRGSSKDNAAARYIPFVFSIDSKHLIELTTAAMRVWTDGDVLTRTTVSTALLNGTITSMTNWSDQGESGATSDYNSGYMRLVGNGTAYAIREQSASVASADQAVEHALRIVVVKGPVLLRVGTTSLDDDVLNEVSLEEGTHSIAFTPNAATIYVSVRSQLERAIFIDTIDIESSTYWGSNNEVEITSPYTSDAHLRAIRYEQSGDVVFIACDGVQQHKVERRSATSWSMVKYLADDGPLFPLNVTTTTITPSAISGNITLTASKDLFYATHVGAIFAITSNGQLVEVQVTAENTFSSTILVTGVDAQRAFTIVRSNLSGTSSTITLQRSFTSESGPWEDVTTYTTDGTVSYNDTYDNAIAWYRIGCKTGDYSSGTIDLSLRTDVGSIKGFVRITAYSSATSVSAEVLKDLGGTDAQDQWQEGMWSDFRGWPTAVAISEARLGWFGKGYTWWGITDAYYSYDEEQVGDSGPITRSIGSGPIDTISWAMNLDQAMVGAQSNEWTAKSTGFGEPMTPTNYQIRRVAGQGSSNCSPVPLDDTGLYVTRGGAQVYELQPTGDNNAGMKAVHITALVPEIGSPGIVRAAAQRKPDTRAHFVRSDGTVAMVVFDRVENVVCWLEITTDGLIEDVVVLPGSDGTIEDEVYYSVKRTINGATKRYLEKWALESECVGATTNKQADSFVTYSQPASSTISGLDHLEAEDVVVWDNGKCLRTAAGAIATFTVSGGAITTTNAGVAYQATTGVVGLTYTGQWKSAKFSELAHIRGLNLSNRSKITQLGLILKDTHHRGIEYGPDFSTLDPMPLYENGTLVADDTVHADYAENALDFQADITNDTRLCLQAKAPRPAKVLASIVTIEAYR